MQGGSGCASDFSEKTDNPHNIGLSVAGVLFLVHNGGVRQTPKAQVRQGLNDGPTVRGMEFAYDGH